VNVVATRGGIEVASYSSMATRSQQFRVAQERRHPAARAAISPRPKVLGGKRGSRSAFMKHAEKKATYAFEVAAADGRHSRKSTRGSANRAKPDTNFNLREALLKGSPEARFRKARARSARVRGSSS